MRQAAITAMLLVALAICGAPSWADNAPVTEQMIRVRLYAADQELCISLIDAGMDLLALRPGEWADLWIPASRLGELEALGYPLEIMRNPPRPVPGYFHRYAEMLTILQAYAADYPGITSLEDIGDGWGKIYNDPDYPDYDVWALKISDNAELDEAEPVILYTGVHHAREPATLEICLAIADFLLTNYGSNPDVTRWVEDHETWVVPLVNPDGHWCCTDMDWTMWRKNARDNDGDGAPTPPGWWYPDGVDPNRNYDWEWGGQGASHDPTSQTYCGPYAFSEPENQAMRDFHYRELPIFTVDYHSYGELVMWSYGYNIYATAPDDATLAAIGAEIASHIPAWGGGYYTPQQASQLYPASGTSADWEYGELNVFSYIIEACTDFYPSENELNFAIQGNVQGAICLQERVDGPGVRGTIRVNGVPAEATITIVGLDDPPYNMPRRSHAGLGDYYRILSPGTYDIRYHAEGWDHILVEDVVVPEETFVCIDVNFGISTAPDLEAATIPGFSVFPSPAQSGKPIAFRLPVHRDQLALLIYDLQGRLVADLSCEARGASSSYTWNAAASLGAGLRAGVYYARLRTETSEAVRRFVVMGH
ncbi:MAG: hypothetical protein KAY24_12475 [Candidatus Eisenbacteria sp.]|nr:hypothetical protein [Candidatus Eisenbacteria bacterium]